MEIKVRNNKHAIVKIREYDEIKKHLFVIMPYSVNHIQSRYIFYFDDGTKQVQNFDYLKRFESLEIKALKILYKIAKRSK